MENNSLAGDNACQSVKESAEWWKKQIRDKLGEGTTSAIANGIINAVTDTGDSAIGSADYVADTAMALASCATGDSYCNKALSDLSGKNQAVADRVLALMKSETWSAVAGTLTQAYDGNQAGLEATGGILASILLPGKKVPDVNVGALSESVAFSAKQLDKKFKHAEDFGVVTTKKNSGTIAEYQTAIKSHLDDKSTYEHGTYLLVPESKVFFNPQTNNVVVVDKSGNFVSGWKLDPQTKQYENFINNGTLR
ncbi:colicin D domain-containing protein [Dickeya zeae]|uniref:colicin D domain-containing protein n=1 Tax=Dickeya zeae TaxID=204042 RepID=UPI000D88164E|nr:colicin D domain-containing protein [Dickeya zeae]PXW48287.1 colicin D [Erwinia sp. AG740]